jgi:hypothetical protein
MVWLDDDGAYAVTSTYQGRGERTIRVYTVGQAKAFAMDLEDKEEIKHASRHSSGRREDAA